MKCTNCSSTHTPIHSARPTSRNVENYQVCTCCGHEVLVCTYEGIIGGLK